MPKKAAVAAARAEADRRGRCYDLGTKLMVAIDPGDVHVGFAVFAQDGEHPACAYAMEVTPDEATRRVHGMLARNELAVVCYERFALYADKAMSQVGSEMLTPEMIGVIKYLVAVHNEHADGVEKSAWAPDRIELWSEGAHVKKAIRAQLKARGIDRVGTVGSHSGDAEEQGWYWLYKKAGE
jgi:hypothetical protein